MNTTRKVNAALADDEDVKLLLARSSALMKSYSQEPLKNPDGSPTAVAAGSKSKEDGSTAATACA
jgi:hypothetical protein